jgi:hypothetical protein
LKIRFNIKGRVNYDQIHWLDVKWEIIFKPVSIIYYWPDVAESGEVGDFEIDGRI